MADRGGDRGWWIPPDRGGRPQGGVISPLLMNVALHGMEAAAGVRYHLTGTRAGKTMPGCPVVIRYADLCRARHKSAYAESWIMPRLASRPLARGDSRASLGGIIL